MKRNNFTAIRCQACAWDTPYPSIPVQGVSKVILGATCCQLRLLCRQVSEGPILPSRLLHRVADVMRGRQGIGPKFGLKYSILCVPRPRFLSGEELTPSRMVIFLNRVYVKGSVLLLKNRWLHCKIQNQLRIRLGPQRTWPRETWPSRSALRDPKSIAQGPLPGATPIRRARRAPHWAQSAQQCSKK